MGNINNSQQVENQDGVLPNRLGGGPMNLGDPDDRTLRKVERDIIILNMVREKIRAVKCKSEGDEMDKCGGDASLAVVWKCRKERDALLECSKSWFYNEDLRQECTEEFLKQRSYYRRTGKPGHLWKEELKDANIA